MSNVKDFILETFLYNLSVIRISHRHIHRPDYNLNFSLKNISWPPSSPSPAQSRPTHSGLRQSTWGALFPENWLHELQKCIRLLLKREVERSRAIAVCCCSWHYRVRCAGKIAEQSTIAFVSENGSPELRMAGHPALPRPSSTPLLKPVESDQIGPLHCIQPACLAHAWNQNLTSILSHYSNIIKPR